MATPSSVLDYGLHEDRNKKARRKMEDASVQIDGFRNDPSSAYFAVFDGHAGKDAAIFCQNTLHTVLDTAMNEETTVESALTTAFETTNALLADSEIPPHQGCTAVVCLLHKGTLYAANAGDARAVLVCAGKAVRLTVDHKASDVEECQRVKDSGGFVQNGRVNGQLELTRSIGDQLMKAYVIATPHVSVTELTSDHTHLIVACDGIWDVLEDQEVADKLLEEQYASLSAKNQAHLLVALALQKGSGDNLSAQVIHLKTQ